MIEFGTILSFLQVVMIDLVLAGDNAIVVGMAAAGLPADQRRRAIVIGIAVATVLRILFALAASYLLAVTGLLLAGGLLLLWVCWKMYAELRLEPEGAEGVEALTETDLDADGRVAGVASRKTLRQAVTQIIVADVSMSLDNVLAVAGAARGEPVVLVFGLLLSVALMGIAASFIAELLHRYRWVGWIGLLVILFVALRMVYHGAVEVWGPAVAFLG
ncbi:MAG: TerC family protein [Amaricoccus sp.]